MKRDLIRYKEEEKKESSNWAAERKREHEKDVASKILESHYLLCKVEDKMGLTSSVMESERKMSIIEFDDLYSEGLDAFHKLESTINTFASKNHDQIRKLRGLNNQYWGIKGGCFCWTSMRIRNYV